MIAARNGEQEGVSERAAYILRLNELLAIVSKDPRFHDEPDLDVVGTIRDEISSQIHTLARDLRDRHALAQDIQRRRDSAPKR